MSSSTSANLNLNLSLSMSLSSRASPNCTSMPLSSSSPAAIRPPSLFFVRPRSRRSINVSCEVAVEESSLSTSSQVGARVRVKVPLKVYHVPKVAELDLEGMEGQIKQYVGLWNGKRISANLPFKVEFVTDIPGRGPVKFSAHLKEDEFEYL